MTNTELAILGLVAEQPRHGYQIEQEIEARGMREWTEIGFSSIYYSLNKMESAGWLKSELEQTDNAVRGSTGHKGPARKVYRVAEAGWAAYREAVRERLANPRPRSGDIDLGLANLPALSQEEARAALEIYCQSLREQKERMLAKWEQDRQEFEQRGVRFPPHVAALFDRSRVLIEAELGWVEQYLREFRDEVTNG